jgi:basic membrane protein A
MQEKDNWCRINILRNKKTTNYFNTYRKNQLLRGGLCLSSTVFAAEPLLVGLVFDIGGKGDKSFNDSASRGLAWAAADFNIKRIELEPGVDADREVNLRNLARIGYDLVIGVGFAFADAIYTVSAEFPDTKFAIVDEIILDRPNVMSLKFPEPHGSFLVGMIAGMKAQEDVKYSLIMQEIHSMLLSIQ